MYDGTCAQICMCWRVQYVPIMCRALVWVVLAGMVVWYGNESRANVWCGAALRCAETCCEAYRVVLPCGDVCCCVLSCGAVWCRVVMWVAVQCYGVPGGGCVCTVECALVMLGVPGLVGRCLLWCGVCCVGFAV